MRVRWSARAAKWKRSPRRRNPMNKWSGRPRPSPRREIPIMHRCVPVAFLSPFAPSSSPSAWPPSTYCAPNGLRTSSGRTARGKPDNGSTWSGGVRRYSSIYRRPKTFTCEKSKTRCAAPSLLIKEKETMNIHLTLGPLIALIAGILILLVPRLLNYIVAIYLIIIGLIGLFGYGGTLLHT